RPDAIAPGREHDGGGLVARRWKCSGGAPPARRPRGSVGTSRRPASPSRYAYPRAAWTLHLPGPRRAPRNLGGRRGVECSNVAPAVGAGSFPCRSRMHSDADPRDPDAPRPITSAGFAGRQDDDEDDLDANHIDDEPAGAGGSGLAGEDEDDDLDEQFPLGGGVAETA